MGLYTLQPISLDVQPEDLEIRARLPEIWSGLFLVRANAPVHESPCRLYFRLHQKIETIPPSATLLFQAGGFAVLERGDSLYLTDDSTVFHLQLSLGRGDAYLSPSFFRKPAHLQQSFWSFGLLKLLRPLRFYSLHAAGLVTAEGQGLLVIGPSGSGKSTLALGLIREGWGYLSDDAVLLHPIDDTIAALALRRNFYIDDVAAPANDDLPLDDAVVDKAGGYKRRVRLEDTCFHARQARTCIPRTLLFTRIVPQRTSTLLLLGRSTALKHLLDASASQLFDRQKMVKHIDLLKQLLRQTTSYEVLAGQDLYSHPGILLDLINEARSKEALSPALSLS